MNFSSFFKHFIESREVINNIEKKSPVEIWKVAQDMRQNPQDYPDIDLFDIIGYTQDRKQEETPVNGFHGLRNSAVRFEHDGYLYTKPADIFPIMKFKKSLLEELRNDSDRLYGRIGNIDDVSLPEMARIYISDFHNKIDNEKRIIDRIKYYMDKGNVSVSKEQIARMQTAKKKLKKLEYKYKEMQKLSKEDMILIFKRYNITAPDIYHYLINRTFSKPKHPSEIPEDYKNLPEMVLYNMFYKGKTPKMFAKNSAKFTGGRHSDITTDLKINGMVRILDNEETENEPTDRESHLWMKYINDNVVEQMKNKPRRFLFDSDVVHRNFPTFALFNAALNTENFPNVKKGEIIAIGDFSFRNWTTFRWFLYNIKSSFFYKKRYVHGPGGQVQLFEPLKHVVHITKEDLPNGLKTSPEKAFESVGRRKAEEYKNSNKNIEFVNYPRTYKDTENVQVLYSQNALDFEGDRMAHCVSGYGSSCEKGGSLILRLPKSTAELNPGTLAIFQHMGYDNTKPPESDRKDLMEWIKLNSTSSDSNQESTHDDEEFDIDLDFLNDEDE